MGTFQIWEAYSVSMARQPIAMLPGKAPQNVTISSTHAESAAFDNATISIRVLSDTDCWILCSVAGTSATSSNGVKVLAGQVEYFGVPLAGQYKLSIITA